VRKDKIKERDFMSSKNVTTLFLILLLCGCQRRPAPLHPALQKAERLMQEHPDSALEILSHYSSKSFSDSADIAAYTLLRTQADDKNYIDHTSDSLIKIATNYYDRLLFEFRQATESVGICSGK
jgi:hypothetical protein